MAFKLDDDVDAFSDINVTPLVDVMLVLLVIFMVTAPLLHQGVEVKLPRSVSQNLSQSPEDPLILSITKSEVYYLNETPIAKALLKDKLKGLLRTRKDKAVYLKADRNLPYGVVVETMDTLNRLGVESLGMVTELKSEAGKGAEK
jgi:biopolymer transport protein TolR